MSYINLPADIPGIRGPLNAFPETGEPISNFTQQLMRGESSLTPAERELIAASVSQANDCLFCTLSHAAVAKNLYSKDGVHIVNKVVFEQDTSVLSAKMSALIDIALSTQKSGKFVSQEQIDRARSEGADDKAIHDTVLIAAAFCMFNRYVDGLAAWTPENTQIYEEIGKRLAGNGYDSPSR
jgi:uncharacterized peroxidase-related enzyme